VLRATAAERDGALQRLRQAEQRAAELMAANAGLQREVARLFGEVGNALAHAHAIGEALTLQVEQQERQAALRASAEAQVTTPTPTGVQRCLLTLRDCLLADGFAGLRFLGARALVDQVLHDVELIDVAAGDAGTEVIVAARMTAVLDRERAVLTLRFEDGSRQQDGNRAALPAAGLEKRLSPVTGRLWEQRLPYLVSAHGEYPLSASETAQDRLDGGTRNLWIERLDALLAAAGTEARLRVGDFRALGDHRFLDARVYGYNDGKLLVLTAECRDLAIEVDERAGIVSLLLRDGALHQRGGLSTISPDGYRMLLPHVTPRRASDAMLGMVVRR
jgi:hypothetical protein